MYGNFRFSKAEFSNVNDDRSAEEAEDLLIRIYGDKR